MAQRDRAAVYRCRKRQVTHCCNLGVSGLWREALDAHLLTKCQTLSIVRWFKIFLDAANGLQHKLSTEMWFKKSGKTKREKTVCYPWKRGLF